MNRGLASGQGSEKAVERGVRICLFGHTSPQKAEPGRGIPECPAGLEVHLKGVPVPQSRKARKILKITCRACHRPWCRVWCASPRQTSVSWVQSLWRPKGRVPKVGALVSTDVPWRAT